MVLNLLQYKFPNISDNVLFIVGLSLSVLFIIGFIANMLLPLLGITRPSTLVPLLLLLNIFVLSVSAFTYYLNHKKVPKISKTPIRIKQYLSAKTVALALIPLLSILGTFLVNFYNINILLLFLIVIIIVIFLATMSDSSTLKIIRYHMMLRLS